MTRQLIAFAAALIGLAPAAGLAQPLLVSTPQVVNVGPGDQVDPHVSCSIATYTDWSNGLVPGIRLFDFTNNVDSWLAPDSGAAHLSDVSGSHIAFTHVSAGGGAQIGVVDIASGTSWQIPGGGQRVNPGVGGGLVAFEDRSFHANTNASEIVAYDIATGVVTRITNDDLMDINPAVSPSGDAVVFQKCQTTGFGCDIYVAMETAPGVFSTRALTGAGTDDIFPVTNGTIVAYQAYTATESHIALVPITGGPPAVLMVPGLQRRPGISGNLISFESATGPGDDYDVFLYDLSASMLYQVTDTPVDEVLNDISVCGNVGRIVYSAPGPEGDYDILALTFTPPAPGMPATLLDARLEITFGGLANDDAFELDVVLALDAGSNGIDPLAEDVTLQIGSYTATIPAGSFALDGRGRLAFEGIVDGVALEAAFWPVGGRYAFRAEAEGVELTGVANPVTVSLQVGNDGGTATVTAEFK